MRWSSRCGGRAVVLIAWAHSSGKLPAFFDHIIDNVVGNADAA
jgi:hypothetical protein